MKENDMLKTQLEDMRTTLSINKDILYKHIGDSVTDHHEIIVTEVKSENVRLSQVIEELFKEKTALEKKVN